MNFKEEFRYFFILLLCLAMFFSSPLSARIIQTGYTQDYIKAAYLFKLVPFIKLADERAIQSICIVGDDMLSLSLMQIQEEEGGRSILVSSKNFSSKFDSCDLIFIGHMAEEFIETISHVYRDRPVLVVSDIKNAVKRGAIVGFVNKDNRIKLEFNIKSAAVKDIKISSKLLEIAVRIID